MRTKLFDYLVLGSYSRVSRQSCVNRAGTREIIIEPKPGRELSVGFLAILYRHPTFQESVEELGTNCVKIGAGTKLKEIIHVHKLHTLPGGIEMYRATVVECKVFRGVRTHKLNTWDPPCLIWCTDVHIAKYVSNDGIHVECQNTYNYTKRGMEKRLRKIMIEGMNL